MKLADCYRLLTHSDRPALVSSVIGSSLAQTYGGVLREPIPRRLLELAERLNRNSAEQPSRGHAGPELDCPDIA